jgi:hypothetical protein
LGAHLVAFLAKAEKINNACAQLEKWYKLFFMKGNARDLLILTKSYYFSEEALEREASNLEKLLQHAESLEQFCIANEIIDINTHKIITSPSNIRKALIKKRNKPFVFNNCKN